MAGPKKNSGLGARANEATAGMQAALDPVQETVDEKPVALNIRLPKPLHELLRKIAFDQRTSINALLIEAATVMFVDKPNH